MQELQDALSKFVNGVIDEQQLCTSIRLLAQVDPGHRPQILRWLRERVGSGRLSAAVAGIIERELFEAAVSGMPGHSDLPTRPKSAASIGPPIQAAPDDATAMREKILAAPGTADGQAAVGTVLSDRFTLVEVLGEGGMGQVFKARDALAEDARDRRPYVALKLMSEDLKRHPDAFIALQREVRRTRELIHENVIRVYELHRDEQQEQVFMTMELLEGRPLDALLRSEFAAGLPLERARDIILGIGEALSYGHEHGIIHSDLKPGNVFVCDSTKVKVLDFGIARPMPLLGSGDDSTYWDPGKRLGALTPAYAALEMFSGEPPDPRDDIYALACLTYELLAGRHPFGRKPAPTVLAEKLEPERIAGLIRPQWQALRMGLALKRADRIPTVKEFLRPFYPASVFKRFRRLILGGAAAIVVAAVIVAAPHVRNAIIDRTIAVYQPKVPPPKASLSPQQKKEIENSLYLANDTLSEVNLDMSPDDFSYLLSEGANSAIADVQAALAIDPGNPDAVALRLQIADLYARKARSLFDAKQVPVSGELVGYGLNVYYSRDLHLLKQKICRESADVCKFTQLRSELSPDSERN